MQGYPSSALKPDARIDLSNESTPVEQLEKGQVPCVSTLLEPPLTHIYVEVEALQVEALQVEAPQIDVLLIKVCAQKVA